MLTHLIQHFSFQVLSFLPTNMKQCKRFPKNTLLYSLLNAEQKISHIVIIDRKD